MTILDPYSNFGRVAVSLVRPILLTGNNLLAQTLGGNFHFQSIYVEPHAVSVAMAVLIFIGVFALLFGQHYCNTICTVGTLLGLLSKYSLFQIRLKHDCVSCGLCEKACKGECIDSKNKTVALVPQTTEEKHRLQIGTVIFLKENCVVETQGANCGACAEHCPTGAVRMVEYGDPAKSLTIPVVDAKLCIGCGACEHICPVRPYRAIYVDGTLQHKEAEIGYDPNAKQEEVQLDDFGF